MLPETERRQQSRRAPGENNHVRIGLTRSAGGLQVLEGVVVDFSETGVGIETHASLDVGELVTVWGAYLEGQGGGGAHKPARVIHCRVNSRGAFRAGCSHKDHSSGRASGQATIHSSTDSFADYYEVLQVSPNATQDTIQRVYRMLAQIYHPDNRETGNQEAFQLLLRAYQFLSDPERRAKYDIQYHAERANRWKIFDQAKAAQGVEAEQRKRWGILSLLYTKRMEDWEHPGLQLRELETLLGCPREHLQFAAWYLREQGLVRIEENARYAITVKGVDAAEEAGLWKPQELPPLLEKGNSEGQDHPS